MSTRRDFLKTIGLCAASVALPKRTFAAGSNKPNIIFILTDDQRYDALSCRGHTFLKTPNMDRLAREGVLFENAFVTTSLCSPSRASFLTGCYAHTHGVFFNSQSDPDPSLPTFSQLLQKAGYETAYIGKWHMAATDEPRPGFDHWVSFKGQGSYRGNKFNIDGEDVRSQGYVTDDLTEYAINFINKDHKNPFLLFLSHKAVHAPFTPAERHNNLFSDIEIESRHNPADNLATKPKWGRKMDKNWRQQIRNYFQTLMAVDESLGRILKSLERNNMLDDTVLVFAGDNGYFHGEHGGMWDKRAAYEPSMRIPLLMRYPARVKAGIRCGQMVLNIDLAPTLLDLAGAAIPHKIQGQSWMKLLAGHAGRESFLYEYFGTSGDRFKRPTTIAIRKANWKYITYPLSNMHTHELYDLNNDPEELDNLSASSAHESVLRQLKVELARLQEKTNFRFPPGRTI